jgi:hypothetical protein
MSDVFVCVFVCEGQRGGEADGVRVCVDRGRGCVRGGVAGLFVMEGLSPATLPCHRAELDFGLSACVLWLGNHLLKGKEGMNCRGMKQLLEQLCSGVVRLTSCE